MLAKKREREHPSIVAASSSSRGTPAKKLRRMTMLTGNAKATSGRMTPRRLFSRPAWRSVMYSGRIATVVGKRRPISMK